MNLLIDIDDTVSEYIPYEQSYKYKDAKLLDGALESVNKLYNEGHNITFFTTRKEEHRQATEEWLKKNGFKYDSVIMNKPIGGRHIIIDRYTSIGPCHERDWKIAQGVVRSSL